METITIDDLAPVVITNHDLHTPPRRPTEHEVVKPPDFALDDVS